jgi:hypothetical protein
MNMNHATSILGLVAAMAISISISPSVIIIEGIFSFPNHAYAASCVMTDGNAVCETLPDEVCTHTPGKVVCMPRNSQGMTPIS